MERNPDDPEDGRTRRRLDAMRRIQAAALDLFERDGFDAVTIDRIAQSAEVGPATVYRNFGSKERIVLWDDYDPELLQAIERRLATTPPLRAVHEAVVERLDSVFARDKRRILRRTRLMLEHPPIAALALSDQAALRDALAALLEKRVRTRLVANVIAAALVSALSVAVMEWAVERAKRPLADVLDEAFAALAAL
ncbi:MAG: helix-turn-helix domain-containing protein [Polyangiaceae bacterium]